MVSSPEGEMKRPIETVMCPVLDARQVDQLKLM